LKKTEDFLSRYLVPQLELWNEEMGGNARNAIYTGGGSSVAIGALGATEIQ